MSRLCWRIRDQEKAPPWDRLFPRKDCTLVHRPSQRMRRRSRPSSRSPLFESRMGWDATRFRGNPTTGSIARDSDPSFVTLGAAAQELIVRGSGRGRRESRARWGLERPWVKGTATIIFRRSRTMLKWIAIACVGTTLMLATNDAAFARCRARRSCCQTSCCRPVSCQTACCRTPRCQRGACQTGACSTGACNTGACPTGACPVVAPARSVRLTPAAAPSLAQTSPASR